MPDHDCDPSKREGKPFFCIISISKDCSWRRGRPHAPRGPLLSSPIQQPAAPGDHQAHLNSGSEIIILQDDILSSSLKPVLINNS